MLTRSPRFRRRFAGDFAQFRRRFGAVRADRCAQLQSLRVKRLCRISEIDWIKRFDFPQERLFPEGPWVTHHRATSLGNITGPHISERRRVPHHRATHNRMSPGHQLNIETLIQKCPRAFFLHSRRSQRRATQQSLSQ